ncbi:MAG: AraC family transcriptional regulator [Deltaproteobacteria bacterium]|nr:AraC family transcriptional regulator [Deltaproteobacteria bacterium]
MTPADPPSPAANDSPSAAVGLLPWQTISEAILRLQLDLDHDWNLEELAGAAGYAAPHFATLFRQVVGEPPLRYLRSLRLERAAQDLVEEDGRSVLEIGMEAGYTSAEAFSRAFRRATGLAPRTFRQRAMDARAGARPDATVVPGTVTMPDVPPGLRLPPATRELGPLFGWTCATNFEPEDVGRAIGTLMQAMPPDGPWQLGGLAQPWGWVDGPRKREFRCVRFSDKPLLAPPPPLRPWRLPRGWTLSFDFRGPMSAIAPACSFIADQWIPRMGMRLAFAPLISQLESLPMSADPAAEVNARLYACARQLGDVFGRATAAGAHP